MLVRAILKGPIVTPGLATILKIRVKVAVSPCRCHGRIEVSVFIANGLARSTFPGGISTDGVRCVLSRTFNPDNSCSPSNEGDAR
jgi:hypothetical protein